MQVGIIGLPNVGKSTLFKALTKKQVDCANYPFCTIEPNVGVVGVPDERLEKIAEISHPEKIIPTAIEFVDIAGLVRGAHKGEGLGNQFLSHIREVDAIVEVVRGFKNPNVIHIEGKINPKSDIETVNLELIFADITTVEKRLKDLENKAKAGLNSDLKKNIETLKKTLSELQNNKPVREINLTEEEKEFIKELCLLTIKPIIYVLNVDEENIGEQSVLNSDIKPIVSLCLPLEAELANLSEKEAKEYLETLNLEKTGLDKLINVAYKTLNLITFFTTHSNITQAWAIPFGTKAPQAAGKIHTDFEKGFIKAEVISFDDYIKCRGETSAREKGLLRIEGKDYVMKDGDVCYFIHRSR